MGILRIRTTDCILAANGTAWLTSAGDFMRDFFS